MDCHEADGDCYREEVLRFDDPLFARIHTTFVLTMEGSPRRARYMAQLRAHRPTGRVVILHNRGRARCAKPGWVRNSAHDLWHANLTALARAPAFPVLVLEDDNEFTPTALAHAREVEAFLSARSDVDLYSLGGIPLVSAPTAAAHHMRLFLGTLSHAWIYTASGAAKLASLRPTDRSWWTHDLAVTAAVRGYTSAVPLAVQRMEPTENSRVWDSTGLLSLYMTSYGDRLVPIHHAFGRAGGLVPVATLLMVILVAAVATCLKQLSPAPSMG